MQGTTAFVVTALLVACISVASAGFFPNGPNPAVPKALASITQITTVNTQKRVVEDLANKSFRNTWVVEFNDLLTSAAEEFAQQHNVHVRRIGNTNKYSVRQKHETHGLDVEMQDQLSNDPRVRSIEFQQPHKRILRQIPTTDPGLCEQWHLYQCPTSSLNAANINIAPAWEKGYTGVAVQIAIVDDGVETTHPDLAANYIAADSYDFNFDDPNPSADPSVDHHGTSCAGLAAAGTNTVCGVGSAFNAKFSALRLISADTTDSVEAEALQYKPNNNHIYSNSWGPEDNGVLLEGPGPLTDDALASTSGRDGKGNIFVWAAGNGRGNGDQSTKDGYASHPNVIAVSAIGRTGRYASYSEVGASIFVTAPGGDSDDLIYTTDITGSNGYSLGSCTSQFAGTSAATPIVAGAVALILEANPALTNRDVRRIIGLTAAKNDVNNDLWFRNAANHWVNYNYGFGLIDVDKAVEAAKTWTNLPAVSIIPGAANSVNEIIAVQKCYPVNYDFNVTIEYVSLYVNIVHTYRGDVSIVIQSPAGTNVTVQFSDLDPNDDINWSYNTYFFLDEFSKGTWQFCFEDVVPEDDGTLLGFSLDVKGRPIEEFVTTATLDSTSDPAYLQGLANVTITFSDDEGVFVASISPAVIVVGEEVPIAVEIVSSTSTSVTAVFTIDTSLPSYHVGSFDIRTSDVSVQNKWLKYMSSGVLIGTLDLTQAPLAPTAVPVAETPVEEPIFVQPPVAGALSGSTSVAVQILMTMLSALVFIVA